MSTALAAFMTQESVVRHLPTLPVLPVPLQVAVAQRIAASDRILPNVPKVLTTARVTEREVLDVIHAALVSARVPAPTGANLTGFEWVEIDSIVAGRLVTEGWAPREDPLPANPNALELARFCLFRSGNIRPAERGQQLAIVSDVPLIVRPVGMELSGTGEVVMQFAMTSVLEPIRLLIVRGRGVAVQGLERLVHLVRRGVGRALCAVHYGYGLEAIGVLPSAPDALIFGPRPPLISDFLNPELALAIPEPKPVHVVRFAADVYSVR